MPHRESTLLKWAFEHSSDGMLITDPKGIILMVNDAFIRMFEYPREEVIGQRTGFLKSEYSTREFYEGMWRSLREEGKWKGEIINRTKSGVEKTCFLTITPIFSDAGEKLGYHGVEIDLTERKGLEDQIIQGEKLAAIGESVATLVHEIRNPLNGISMNIYMLEHAADSQSHWSEEERESIHLISREARRLDGLVKNVLTYARKTELHYERVMLRQFLIELEELLAFQAEQAEVELAISLQREDLTGRFDPDQIKQVLLNLVQNAIDAAGHLEIGKVKVTVRASEDSKWQSISSTGSVLLFEVANTGSQISDDMKKQLFRPFVTTKAQGLGLGLATSAKIVRQHHGTIEVCDATEDPYTTMFSVVLPS